MRSSAHRISEQRRIAVERMREGIREWPKDCRIRARRNVQVSGKHWQRRPASRSSLPAKTI